ncbi:MAG TPA: hypothetical protein VGI61_07375 [Parafilimonas sp.]
MQENEFEQQLKKAMEDFRLSPSASVWEKVKQKLDEKKRRKIPFFFLLAATLVTGYFINYISKQHQQISTEVATDKNKSNHKTIAADLKGSNKLNKEVNAAKQSFQDTSLTDKTKHLQYNLNLYNKEKVIKQINSDVVINEKIKQVNRSIIPIGKNNSNNSKQQLNAQNLKENINTDALNNISVHQPSIPLSSQAINNDSTAIAAHQNIDGTVKNINNTKTGSLAATGNAQPSNSKHATIKPVRIYKNPNWKFGFTASYGRSKLIENTKQFSGIAPQYLNSNIGATPSLAAVVSKTHPFSSSDAYSFGVVIQKKIFKTGYVSSGLNFTHLSAKASVNNKIDSSLIIQTSNDIRSFYAVNGYYQAGSLKTFASNYNFIELPVSFQQYFFQKKQTSLSYNAGFSVRQLLSSNAIIYNPNNNIYFSKDNFFHKTQFQLSAGLNVEINTGKNNSIFIGPQFSYSLFNLPKNNNSGSFHFINYGLQAGFLLHKK